MTRSLSAWLTRSVVAAAATTALVLPGAAMAFAGSSGDGEFGQLVPADVVQALSSDIPEQVRLTAAELSTSA